MLNEKQLANVQKAVNCLNNKGQSKLQEYFRYPTQSNSSYLTGYLTCLYENNLLPSWEYDILLVLSEAKDPYFLLKEINWKVKT